MKDELIPFQTLSRPHVMREWLTTQRDAAIKTLTVDRDPPGLHQAQGKVQLLDRMLALLDKASESR
jgi:hypothetical protein